VPSRFLWKFPAIFSLNRRKQLNLFAGVQIAFALAPLRRG
jgi:hypothetical protein